MFQGESVDVDLEVRRTAVISLSNNPVHHMVHGRQFCSSLNCHARTVRVVGSRYSAEGSCQTDLVLRGFCKPLSPVTSFELLFYTCILVSRGPTTFITKT